MTQWLILAILLPLVGYALWRCIRRARHGGGCCGTHDGMERKRSVSDRHKAHYPYTCHLTLGGMTCENCARRVENALNALEGVWASVDLSRHSAIVRTKEEISESRLRQAVTDAGYVVLSCTKP